MDDAPTELELDGVIYYRYPNAKRRNARVYYVSNHDAYHRKLWEKHNGPLPAGCHVHHRDHNPLNNALDNLEPMSPGDHTRLHFTDARRDESRAYLDAARHLAAVWHSSEEGIEWHRKHGAQMWEGKEPRNAGTCECCGGPIVTRDSVDPRFCSAKCSRKLLDKGHRYDQWVPCPVCGKEFWQNKYKLKPETCSRLCGAHIRRSRRASVQSGG